MEGMIDEPMLTVKGPASYGGLLICGTNYGLARGDSPKNKEESFAPEAKYFTQPSHKNGNKFVSRLALWFDWWGLPLETEGCPTELNNAISQTNLFYDSTKSFASRRQEERDFAYARLKEILTTLNISGLLVASSQLFDETRRSFSLPEWRLVQSGRYWMGFSSSGGLRVAVCPHPTSRQSQKDVEQLGDTMRKWVAEILEEQKKRKAAQ
jgi:hypothetical protein